MNFVSVLLLSFQDFSKLSGGEEVGGCFLPLHPPSVHLLPGVLNQKLDSFYDVKLKAVSASM